MPVKAQFASQGLVWRVPVDPPRGPEASAANPSATDEQRPMNRARSLTLWIVLTALLPLALSRADVPQGKSGVETIPLEAADLELGQEINETCAGCHGEHGQGGKEGEYPRLAGLPTIFIAEQLLLFRDRTRTNLAMVEYVDHRQMPDDDIAHISAYLASIELPTRLPPADESAPGYDSYQRLLDAKKVVQIPTAEGDVGRGERLYKRECGSCHGKDGMGKKGEGVPLIAGQYTSYLWRQVDKYLARQRIHDKDDPDDELLAAFTREEIRDILAYVSTLDDGE
jgi:cytochrome c553